MTCRAAAESPSSARNQRKNSVSPLKSVVNVDKYRRKKTVSLLKSVVNVDKYRRKNTVIVKVCSKC